MGCSPRGFCDGVVDADCGKYGVVDCPQSRLGR